MRETTPTSELPENVEDAGGLVPSHGDLLQFETLLSDLSARFVNVSPEQVDQQIEDALKQVLVFFQADRCGLLELSPDRKVVRVSHIAYAEGVERVSKDIDLAAMFPWHYRKLVIEHRHVAISTPEDLPEEAERDRQSHIALGNRATLDIPLLFGGQIVSIFVLNVMRRHQVWPEEYVFRLRLMGEIFVNALEHKRARQQLEERLRFEMLLSDLSARFISIPADQVDGEIEDAQRRICECLGLDLSALWQWSNERLPYFTQTHLYRPLGGPPPPERIDAQTMFPWCLQQLLAGTIICFSSMEELPPEAARDREVWYHYGIKSVLTFPLSAGGGQLIGALGFNTVREERSWPDEIVNRLQLVARVFTNALVRKRSDEMLRESEERLSLATKAADAGLWIMEVDSGKVWVSAETRELFHFAPDEEVFFESFFKRIHPDDHEHVNQAVQRALQSGDPLQSDYRIVLPDGSIRWIGSRGQRYLKSSGEPDRLMGVSVDITERKRMERELQARLSEIEGLKLQLEKENVCLREELLQDRGSGKIIGSSDALHYVLFRVGQVAPTDATVLILGETGTGKGMVANAIHGLSRRCDRPMITVNCAALPANLIESELFGREKGAFTGAHVRQAGRFEVADGGTIFLDEIGELPLELQSKLLRVLQDGEFERLGSAKTVKVDVRVIASTSRDLNEEMRAGQFREDLYYRLNVFPVSLPPLRKRAEDIPELVRFFVDKYARKIGKRIETISKAAMKALEEYPWPGNVRELEHVIERAIITSPGTVLQLADRLEPLRIADNADQSLKGLAAIEREHILRVLEETGWKIEGPKGAASILKLNPSTLRFRIRKLDIRRPEKNRSPQ